MKKNVIYILSSISFLFLINILLNPITVLAWGDNTEGGKGRPSYTIDEINQGVLGKKIIFNTISDSPMGNEKNFVGARENTGINAGEGNTWYGNDIDVEDGKEYLIRLYVHNNSPWGMDAVAENVHVAFNIPQESARDIEINGFIKAANAEPSEYWDYVNLHANTAFHLEYIYGSAFLENNAIGSGGNGGYQLSDDIVNAASGGTLIGYDKIDGRIPGCYQYSAYICIRVKVVYDTHIVDTKVRIKDSEQQAWKDIVEAEIGDEVEFRIEYQNISNQPQERVVIRDILPDNLEYVEGSTILVNSNHPNGATTKSRATVEETGIVIGDYNPGANAIIYLNAKVVDTCLAYGKNTMTNWGRATASDRLMHDWAQVIVQKNNHTPVAIASISIIFGMVLIALIFIMFCLIFIISMSSKKHKNKNKYLKI